MAVSTFGLTLFSPATLLSLLLLLLVLLLLLPLLLMSYLSDKIRCSYAPYKTISLRYRFHESDNVHFHRSIQSGNRAYGEITCDAAEPLDQGAYSCEAINIKGSCFAGSAGCGQPGQVSIQGEPNVLKIAPEASKQILRHF